jgi:hypothetical protein
MAGQITLGSIPALLRPGIDELISAYKDYPAQYKEWYDARTSNMAWEVDVMVKLLGPAQFKQDGSSIFYDNMGQRWSQYYVHKNVAIGFIITSNAIRDNLYKSKFPMQQAALKKSLLAFKETLGAAVLNNGFDGTNFPIGDGVALFSTAHPIDTGTVANTFVTQADLNETSLQDAINGIMRFKDEAGILGMFKAQKLGVPIGNQWVAKKLLGSVYEPGSGNNAINSMYDILPQGYAVNTYYTDDNAWYVKTDADTGFKHFTRDPLEIDTMEDFDTKSVKVSAVERYSFGVSDFRAAWGSSGVS